MTTIEEHTQAGRDLVEIYKTRTTRLHQLIKRLYDAGHPLADEMIEAWIDHLASATEMNNWFAAWSDIAIRAAQSLPPSASSIESSPK